MIHPITNLYQMASDTVLFLVEESFLQLNKVFLHKIYPEIFSREIVILLKVITLFVKYDDSGVTITL